MLKVKKSKALMIEFMLRYDDKEEPKQANAEYIINNTSEFVKILRGL